MLRSPDQEPATSDSGIPSPTTASDYRPASGWLRARGRALSEQRRFARRQDGLSNPMPRLAYEAAPLGQCGRASLFVELSSNEMPLLIEMIMDLSVN